MYTPGMKTFKAVLRFSMLRRAAAQLSATFHGWNGAGLWGGRGQTAVSVAWRILKIWKQAGTSEFTSTTSLLGESSQAPQLGTKPLLPHSSWWVFPTPGDKPNSIAGLSGYTHTDLRLKFASWSVQFVLFSSVHCSNTKHTCSWFRLPDFPALLRPLASLCFAVSDSQNELTPDSLGNKQKIQILIIHSVLKSFPGDSDDCSKFSWLLGVCAS